jgi:hypothetical protein
MNSEYKLCQDGRSCNTSTDPPENNELINISEKEQILKGRFQQILNEKENEVPFTLNGTTFNLND